MQATDFGLYMISGAFLDAGDITPSSIVWEHIPDHLIHANTQSSAITHTTRANLGYDMRADGDVVKHIKTQSHTILILDTLTTESIATLVAAISELDPQAHRVTICNIGSGVTGVINKHTLDSHDIEHMLPYMRVVEPCDVMHLHHVLKDPLQGPHTYMRIPRDELPEMLFGEGSEPLYAYPQISLQPFGYTGNSGTILTNGALLPYVSHALQHMHTETDKRFDLFVVTDYTASATKDLQESIEQTGHVIIIHDAADIQGLTTWRSALAIPGSRATHIKLPTYQKLTTFLPAYMYDAAGMGQETLVEYLQSI